MKSTLAILGMELGGGPGTVQEGGSAWAQRGSSDLWFSSLFTSPNPISEPQTALCCDLPNCISESFILVN